MYSKTAVPTPQAKGKIVLVKKVSATYVYYQTDRIYDSAKKYTAPKRCVIGKVLPDASGMMLPNEKYFEIFPNAVLQEEDENPNRSYALRIGNYTLIKKLIAELDLENILGRHFEKDDLGILLDLAAYSIITENNAGQYYPMYAFEHAVFTSSMRIYSDSKISKWLGSVTASQIIGAVNAWNDKRTKSDPVYISYDSTNKNTRAGDIEFAEYGAPKDDQGVPIVNYSLAYDIKDRLPLFYESYPGSINDVSQFKCMIEKAKAYGYKNIGFILDRGYFSEENIKQLDENKYGFIIMVKGRKKLLQSAILENLHTFEKKSSYYIERHDLFGCTVMRKLFDGDTKERYIHLYHNASREAFELRKLNEQLCRMKREMDKSVGLCTALPKTYSTFFNLYYEDIEVKLPKNDEKDEQKVEVKRKFVAYEEKSDYVEMQRELCGYFAIATSKKMSAREALEIYESRDASEKLFRGDKSYLGDYSMRTHHTESTETKIFVEFIALIIRSRIYSRLHDYNLNLTSMQNYMTVPAAIRELEKILMIKLNDGQYHLAHAVTKTQRTILSAFSISTDDLIEEGNNITGLLKQMEDKNNGKA